MFLCQFSPGLISLLSFSEFCLFICKWKTSERLVRVGVGVGGEEVEAEMFVFKATGVPIWKSTQLISCFCLYDFELKGWSNSFRRLSCLYNGPSWPIYSLVLLGLKKKKVYTLLDSSATILKDSFGLLYLLPINFTLKLCLFACHKSHNSLGYQF